MAREERKKEITIPRKRAEITAKPAPLSIEAQTLEHKRRMTILYRSALTAGLVAVIALVATRPQVQSWMSDIFSVDAVEALETAQPEPTESNARETPITSPTPARIESTPAPEADLNELSENAALCANPNRKKITATITHPDRNTMVVTSDAPYLPVREKITEDGKSYSLPGCLGGGKTENGYEYVFNINQATGELDGLEVVDGETEEERYARIILTNTPQIIFTFLDKTQDAVTGRTTDFGGKEDLPNGSFAPMVAAYNRTPTPENR